MAGETRHYDDAKTALYRIEVDDLAGMGKRLAKALKSKVMLEQLGDQLRSIWVHYAENELTTTRDAYVQSIGEPEIKGGVVGVSLSSEGKEGAIAMMVEEGWSGAEFKEALLGGRDHRVIRFEQRAANTRHGPPLAHGYKKFGGPQAAREIAAAVHPYLAKLRKGSLAEVPDGLGPVMKNHRRDLVAGIRYEPKGMSRGSHRTPAPYTSYAMYRTVSEDSDGWNHPGVDARRYGDRSLEALDKVVDAVIDRIVEDALK